jgi:hypothetical protein
VLKGLRNIGEIRRMGKMGSKQQLPSPQAKGKLWTRGMTQGVVVICAMFALPFLLRMATRALGAKEVVAAAIGQTRGGGAAARTSFSGVGGFLAPGQYKIIYSPDENLEGDDVALLGAAHSTVDAALYSATDMELCDALAKDARDGVKVRVYRDREQYGEEEQRARGRGSCTAELIASGAEVKVKSGDDLMHMKSYAVDGQVLRTGSANLSLGGERYQDNDAVFIASPSAARGFERDFAEMWVRPSNVVVRAEQ